MCGGGSGGAPEPAPLPAPTPVPVPADTDPLKTSEQKRGKVSAMKYGLMSTIKNTAGITGAGADLTSNTNAQGKKTLGS